jgi:hypothetical protein
MSAIKDKNSEFYSNEDNHCPVINEDDNNSMATSLTNVPYPDFNTLKKLGTINSASGCLHIHEYNTTIQDKNVWTNLLPGQFRIYEQVLLDDGDRRKSHLFLLHDTMLEEIENGMHLSSLRWKLASHTFELIDNPIKIIDPYHYENTVSNTTLIEKLSDLTAVTIGHDKGNMVLFSMVDVALDIQPTIVKNKDLKIIAIRIGHIGSYVNTVNRQFVKACKSNQLETVKYLLYSEELPIKANLDYMSYEGLQWALLYSHHEMIAYLLEQAALCVNSELDNEIITIFNNAHIKEYFLTYSQRNMTEVCQLIHDLPLDNIDTIGELLLSSEKTRLMYYNDIKNTLDLRHLYEKMNKEMIQNNINNSLVENEHLAKI